MREQQRLGVWQGVALDVVTVDGAAADVDLSFACMFRRELGGAPRGGLLHLDDALSGALIRLRDEGVFLGEPMETLLVRSPPSGVAARAVMVIGMGEPMEWTATVTGRAVATAIRAAMQLGVASAAFAPSLLDTGLEPKATEGVAAVMMQAVTRAIDVQARIAASGLTPAPSLRRWVFDVGPKGFAGATEQFQAALNQMSAQAAFHGAGPKTP